MIKYVLIASVFALGCGSAPLGVDNNLPDSGTGNAPGETGGATGQGNTGGTSNATGGSDNSGGDTSVTTGGASNTGGVTGSGGDTSNSTGGSVSTGGADNSGGDTGNSTGGTVSTGGSVNETGGSISTGGTTSDAGNDASTGGTSNDSGGPVCTPASCVLTQGYWKNHPDWAVQSLQMGGATYTKDECLALLNLPSYTDGSVILAKQLVAAILNGGACDPNIMATVQIAQDWMSANKDADGTLPYGTICVNPEDTGCTAIAIGTDLDRYNSGLAGTPACK